MLSLSVIVTVVAIAAVPVVSWLRVATYEAPIAVPCQTPVLIVPTLVSEELSTPLPNVVALNTELAFIL